MTRNAHVGDLGKTAVQLTRDSRSSRNIVLYKPLKISSHHRGNMEYTFLDGILLGMRLRSDENLVGTARGAVKARTLRRRVEEELWDNEFARLIKGEPWQPVPEINSDHVPAAISDRAGMHLEEDQRQRLVWDTGMKVLIHRKHEKFRRHETDSSPRNIQTR